MRRDTETHTRMTLAAAAVLALAACGSPGGGGEQAPAGTDGTAATEAGPPAEWNYGEGAEGPEHWAELDSSYAACSAGTEQSPVELSATAAQDTGAKPVTFNYGTGAAQVTDTGHTLQASAEGGNTVTFGDQDYTLQQMHFHAPSEHVVDGRPAPAEFHFVHRNADGQLLVVAALAAEGEPNQAWTAFIAATGPSPSPQEGGSIDWAGMLPADTSSYQYEGSLTTPPCSEDVQWVVLKTPVELGPDQIAGLESSYEGNNRPLQPLEGREVAEST